MENSEVGQPIGSDDGNRRTFSNIAKELWRQKPGPRTPRPVTGPITSKEIVNGLDRRETMIGSFLAAFAVVLAVLGYFNEAGSAVKSVHASATDFLITMMIGAFLLGLGLFMRRRALLGFAAFLFGLEQATFQFLPGALIYIAFGCWLIYRVMQKSKADRAAGIDIQTIDSGFRVKDPKPSKRYTPPKSGQRRSS